MTPSARVVDAMLIMMIAFDVVLIGTVIWDPGLWFEVLHGSRDTHPLALAFLYRSAGHWAAFTLFQGLALALWKSRPEWLLIVAGVRFSDVFTDWTYLATSDAMTGIGIGSLIAPGVFAWIAPIVMVWAYSGYTRPAEGAE